MTEGEKQAFVRRVTDLYAEHMETGTDHVAVAVRERSTAELAIGRAGSDEPCLLLEADVRRGREFERKRSFALAVVELAADAWGIRDPNVKIVFTEHAGEELMGAVRVGSEWSPDESN
jgi:phenylpyruvate tautomerase PptA (4-oxalocrotonate tautomerase family)